MNRRKQAIHIGVQALRNNIAAPAKPTNTSLVPGRLRDLVRTTPQRIADQTNDASILPDFRR